MNIFTKLSLGSLNVVIAILISTFILIGCSSSRIFLNADVPKGQDIEITITTEKSKTN
tara:strand:- start:669 stop:842 length:174 start_codon:yes stop_codon:yes gene_type:complete